MKRRFAEWWSTARAKYPGRMVIGVILLFNILFILLSASLISALSLDGTENMGWLQAAFCTITMILDAGCIQFVIADIGRSGVFLSLFCLGVVLVGMISFTGAVIGYVTNTISSFINNANSGKHKIVLSNHVVILNWNSRASEIINDYLYSENKQKVVVLVSARKQEVEREIEERLADTISRENKAIEAKFAGLPWFSRKIAVHKNRFRKNVTVLVREGEVFSTKQLKEVSLDMARAVVILGNDINNSICHYEQRERLESKNSGNVLTVKTLMQVADITSTENSLDNQRIIVEITDDWTWELVKEIIKSKQVDGKCNIVPVRVNQVLGQLLSQFSLMPHLNAAYEELFSNRGMEFYTVEQPQEDMTQYAKKYLSQHKHAIPLTFMRNRDKTYGYYVADCDEDLSKKSHVAVDDSYKVNLNRDYWIEKKNIVILGHNSKSKDIMQGFHSFCCEWNKGDEQIVQIVVIDDEKNLEKMGYYKQYPFVAKTVAADIFDHARISNTIEQVLSESTEDVSILILSDDAVRNEDIDSNTLANLIYVKDILRKNQQQFKDRKIDIVVEIIDPKHHDIINSYSINNVVISNRYISKMITQIGEVDALFEFYVDILSYDEEDDDSKEIYIKDVDRFFNEIPAPCTADKLIRALLEASTDESLPPKDRDPNFAIGYVKRDGTMVFFGGDQSAIPVNLEKGDKLIIFSSH